MGPKKSAHIKHLDLSSKALQWPYGAGEGSDQFEALPYLETLNLSGNKIEALPTSFQKLIQLRELNLANNDLYYWGIHNQWHLNDIQCPKLEKLDLSGNEIGYIKIPLNTPYRESLIELHLSDNHFPSWYDHRPPKISLTPLPRLEKLDLSWNHLQGVPNFRNCLPHLRTLILSYNPLRCNHHQLLQLPKLEVLNLRSTQLKRAPQALAQLTGLTHLYLQDNEIPADQQTWLKRQLPHTVVEF